VAGFIVLLYQRNGKTLGPNGGFSALGREIIVRSNFPNIRQVLLKFTFRPAFHWFS
jgi:hypothetical protein